MLGRLPSSAVKLARLEYQAFEHSIYVSRPELLIKTGRTIPLTEPAVTSLAVVTVIGFP